MDGQMGECPPWYVVISAARYLGVPPWELLNQPRYWTEWAVEANYAEVTSQKSHQERQQRRGKKG